MAPMPGEIPFAVARDRLAPGLAISDRWLLRSVAFAATGLKLVVEPGAAAALAAILSGTFDAKGMTIAVVLSGGNCDLETLVRASEEV
jgi:threonine dehydratase